MYAVPTPVSITALESRRSSITPRPRTGAALRLGIPPRAPTASSRTSREWVVPQDVEDGRYVANELDRFETLKVRHLVPTLSRPDDALPLDTDRILDKEAQHRIMKAHMKFTGGRRPGSKANQVVIYRDRYFRRYADPIETGKSPLLIWLHDLRELRVHPFVLQMRSKKIDDAALLTEAWFRHSKQNTQMTMTNSHTALRGFVEEVLCYERIPCRADLSDCRVFYDLLNDRKHQTLSFAPAAAKLHILLSVGGDSASWEPFARHFFSGAFRHVGATDFVSAFEFGAMISVFETLLEETEVTFDVSGVEPTPMCTALRKTIEFCKSEVAEFSLRAPGDRMLMRNEAFDLLNRAQCFFKLLVSAAYDDYMARIEKAGELLVERKKQAERDALLSRGRSGPENRRRH